MKKSIFTLLGMGVIMSAWAANDMPENLLNATNSRVLKPTPERILTTPRVSKPIVTRTGEDTYEFGYCAGIGTALGYPSGYPVDAAIEIPSYLAQAWEGMEVTKVFIGFGYNGNRDVYVFVTEDLEAEPVILQQETMEYEALEFNAAGTLVAINQVWNEVELKEPYKIDGTPFYVGYEAMCDGDLPYPICFDNIYSDTLVGDIFGAPDGENGEMIYYNMGTYCGNVSLRIELRGEMKADYDALNSEVMLESSTIGKEDEFNAGFTLSNIGGKTITGLDLTCTIGGEPVEDLNVNIYGEEEGSIPFGVLGYVEVTGKSAVTGANLPFEINITGLKGEDGEGAFRARMSTVITVSSKSYPRNFVVEEFTGTWCSWCPRGLVGMEYMQENYTDQGFIGIAVHANTSLGSDPMSAESYQEMASWYSQGSYPSAVLFRNEYFDPSVSTLEEYWAKYKNIGAFAKVGVNAQYDEEARILNMTGTSEFADGNQSANYMFAFVLTQDNVGPYYQQNAFSGGSYGAMDGWENKARRVSTMYNMVARYIEDGFGIEGSIPDAVEADKEYSYSVAISIDEVEAQTDQDIPVDINNCYAIALVLDGNSGEILNGAQISLKGQAGVEGIMDDPTSEVYKVYNPQGIKVLETKNEAELNALPNGIYIINGKKVAL